MSTAAPHAALCIGVNDYHTFDQSIGQPAGSSDLRGAVMDALAWAEVALRIGVPASQITVLTSPPLAPADQPAALAGATFGLADGAALLAAVDALAQRLGKGRGGQGLLSYSGHGTAGEAGAALCPSDVSGPDLTGAIALSDLSARLDRHAPHTNLTVVLDTCHAAGATHAAATGRRRGLGRALPATGARLRPRDLVLAGCALHESSAEGEIGGRPMGWFTWAMTSLMSRWGLLQDADGSYVPIGYTEATQRAAAMLAALDLHQTPVFEGPARLEGLPLFHPLTRGAQGAGKGPAAELLREIDPGSAGGIRTYDITGVTGSGTLGWLVVVGNQSFSQNGQVWQANSEYWKWSGPAFPASGFGLRLVGDGVPKGAAPGQATRYASMPFATSPAGVVTVQGLRFNVGLVNGNAVATQGWLQANGTALTWWSAATANTPPWFATATTNSTLLRFSTTLGAGPNPSTAYPVIGPMSPL